MQGTKAMNSIESEESPVHATQIRAALVLDLFDLYYERVFAFLRKSTTPDAAEDLAQETFVRLLQHPDLESLTLSISYLLKIAHNLLRRRYARASRLRELLEERAHNEPELSGGVAKASKYAAGDLGSQRSRFIPVCVCEIDLTVEVPTKKPQSDRPTRRVG